MPRRLPTFRTPALRAAVVASALATTAAIAVVPAADGRTAPNAVPVPSPTVGAVVTAAPVRVAQAAPAAGSAGSVGSAALRNALGKVGAPYRWGATGPNAFDCSGLVHWAFDQEGVSLPRTSRAMAGAGTPVSRADLRPGDVVLFYRPVSHVGIYVGGGRVVHASTSGTPVRVADLDAMPFHSARRI